MTLQTIEKKSGITAEVFQKNYLTSHTPVVFKDLAHSWPATSKWTFDYLKTHYGHLIVPLYGNDFHKPGKNYMVPTVKMPFGDYLDLIQAGPCELRMFLYNIMQHAPEMANDVHIPTVMKGFVKEYPFMFFGGQDAVVNLHYDIDCASVFLTQFLTRKRVILFGPEQSKLLYQHPFTVQSHVNVLKPDFDKFPAARYLQGYETTLEHGETIYIPSTYWHFIHYVDGGFGISLRAHENFATKMRGVSNISRHLVVDKGMNALIGADWKNWKEKQSVVNAEKVLKNLRLEI